MLEAIALNEWSVHEASDKLKQDEEFLFKVVQTNASVF